MKPIVIGILTVTLATTMLASGAQKAQDVERQLKAAMNTELVDGNLKAAIEQYKKVAQSGNRALAAQALIRMAECYQKLGDAEAQKIYEQVLRDYADQKEAVATARARLGNNATASYAGIVTRQVWTGPDVDLLGAPSLDGRYLSFVDWETGDLAVRDLATGEKRRLTNRPPGEFAFYSRISPDGQKVAYVWVDKENPYHLRITSINDLRNGVKPRVLFRNTPFYMDFGDWSPDGKSVLAGIRGIDLISVSDGAITTLKTLNWGRAKPRFSPDGRWIVYNVQPNPDSPDRDILVLAADGSRETPLVEHPGDDFVLGWAPDGKRILFASDRSGVLSAWAIAVADGKPQGAPELVKPDIGNIEPMGFTRTGAFYYGLSTGMQDVYVATLDPATGRVVTPPAPVSQRFQGRGSSPAWSADGQFIAYLSNRRTPVNLAVGPRVICIRSLKTGEEREVSTPLSFEISYRLHWSPDGRFLLATATDGMGRGGLYRIDVQSGVVQPIVQGPDRSFRPVGVWSTDGKAIIFYERNLGIRSRDLGTGEEVELYKAADDFSRSGLSRNLALSPDGRWLAFGDRGVVMIMSSTGGAPRELLRIRPDEGSFSGLEWAGDGKYLLFSIGAVGPGPKLTPELWRIAVDGGQRQKVGLATQNVATLAIHPDGGQIAFTAGETKQEVWVMENLLPPLKAAR